MEEREIYYNLKNGKFNSFYILGEHDNYIYDKDGKINKNFYEINSEEYQKLISSNMDIAYKDGELIPYKIPDPPKDIFLPNWNGDEWLEGSKEKLIELRKNKILEYGKLEEEKRIFENTKFPLENEVEVIVEKMSILEADINNLQEKIKAL